MKRIHVLTASSYVLYLSLLSVGSKVPFACEKHPVKHWPFGTFSEDMPLQRFL